MASSHRRFAVAASAASLVLLVPLAPAFARHTNTLLEASLTGRAEVGTTKALAGDPNAPFLPPPKVAIARTLLEHWLAA